MTDSPPIELRGDALKALSFKVHEAKVRRVFLNLKEKGIRGILIKGVVSARNYPDPYERFPGDIDLVLEQDLVPGVTVSVDELESEGCDLHLGLRQLDSLDFEQIYVRSEMIELDGCPIPIPCPEDHLRILCVHWLTDGGERKERLWDIYWAVRNRPDGFDWNKCLDVVSERRQRWIICTIGLAHVHLDLPIDDLPFAERAKDLPKWFTTAIEKRWASGVGHIPIHRTLHDRRAFLAQLRKRFPPNPVMATIGMEGDFDSPTRVHYQIGFMFKQSIPSVKRIWETITRRG